MAEEELPQDEAEPEAVAAESPDLLGDLPLAEREEMQAALDQFAATFSGEDEVEEDAPDEPEEDVEEEEAEPERPVIVAEQPTPTQRNVVVINGAEIPVEEAVKYLLDQQQAQPAPEPPKPPEWLDQDDPAQVAMWTRQQELERQVAVIGQSQQQIAQQQATSRAISETQDAMTAFAAGHPELSPEDVQAVRLHAVSLNIINGLHESFGGSNTPGAGTAAVGKALDMAYWDHPEFRARAVGEPTPSEKKKATSEAKKAKLNALGGSSGSAARTEAKPDLSSDQSAKKAAKEWLEAQNIL